MYYFKNGPEYEARLKRPFRPPTITLKEIHDAVPKHLLQPNPTRAMFYVLRDVTIASFFYKCASHIVSSGVLEMGGPASWKAVVVKGGFWSFYWVLQSLVFAGIFCLGHDAGHGSLFRQKYMNNTVGFLLHTFLLIPYFSWRATHHAHHKATASMERDENYVPYTRSKFGLPEPQRSTKIDYKEAFEETPLFTIYRLWIQQFFGWWVYLSANVMGGVSHPPGTNHFNPKSTLFKPQQRTNIILSDVSIVVMLFVLYRIGWYTISRHYLIPFFLLNHWIGKYCCHHLSSCGSPSDLCSSVMFTFLHHSDPTIPHYRKNAWSFLRGAAATIDRPLLGWVGRFFFHNISHDHVSHHFFLSAPFFNGPHITKVIKEVLKDDYNYDSTPSLYALWRSFTQCIFVEEDGDIIFYKDKDGNAARELAVDALLPSEPGNSH